MHSARLTDCARRGAGCSAARSTSRSLVTVRAAAEPAPAETSVSRRALVASVSVLSLGLTQAAASHAETAAALPSSSSTLLEELREREREGVRVLKEEADRTKDGKLCGTPFGVDVVGITQLVALIGALVGGVVARQRKEEVERLNEQLRKINLQLKKKLKTAPANVHAPARLASLPAAAAASAEPSTATRVASTFLSMEEEDMTPDQLACRDALRTGKQLLREKSGPAAMVRFEKALMLSRALGDRVQERRANRGLAAAARLQGQYRTAIMHYERVLSISQEIVEFSGYADVYGAIADCYTDLGELDKAAAMYDKYIAAMNSDMMPLAV